MPAHTTLAEAPISVPLPPRQAPKASAHTKGRSGTLTSGSDATCEMMGAMAVVKLRGKEGR